MTNKRCDDCFHKYICDTNDFNGECTHFINFNSVKILPCAIGTDVYYIEMDKCFKRIAGICTSCCNDCIHFIGNINVVTKKFTLDMENRIGYTVFLTYDEAVQKMCEIVKNMLKNNNINY